MDKERKCLVYVHTNKTNKKRYVGITSQANLKLRSKNGKAYKGCPYFYRAIEKYGWDNFDHEVLVSNLTETEAKEMERFYIELFRTTNLMFGYNIDSGGGMPVRMSPEGRQSMIVAISGANAPRARPVVVFDSNGNKINEFGCIVDAERFYNQQSLWGHINSRRGTRGGMMFRFKDDVGDIEKLPEDQIYKKFEQRLVRDENSWHSTPVTIFDAKTGERVADFACIKHANEFIGANTSSALRGKSKTVGGYICRYSSEVVGVDKLHESELPVTKTTGKEVHQFDYMGNLIGIYPSAREAERQTGISAKNIFQCVNHKSHSAGGFVWRFATDKSPFVAPKKSWETMREKGYASAIPVDQIDLLTGNIVATYSSIGEAARATGTYKTSIKKIIDKVGNNRSAAGFGWQYHKPS